MSDDIQTLKQEIAALRQQCEDASDWGNGLYLVMEAALPLLLRNHPNAGKVQTILKQAHDRYLELEQHPEKATDDDLPLVSYEPAKMLYLQMDLLKVWPDQ